MLLKPQEKRRWVEVSSSPKEGGEEKEALGGKNDEGGRESLEGLRGKRTPLGRGNVAVWLRRPCSRYGGRANSRSSHSCEEGARLRSQGGEKGRGIAFFGGASTTIKADVVNLVVKKIKTRSGGGNEPCPMAAAGAEKKLGAWKKR